MATALPSPRTVGGWDRGSATEQSYVWVPDAQKAWRVGRVVEWVGADSVRVILPDTPEPILFPREKTKVWDVSHSLYLEDAAKLNNLHEGALLNLLKSRFDNDDIYTMCGDVLVSVNPYKTIPLLYQIPEGSGTALRNRMQSIANTPCNLRRRSVQDFGGDSSDSDEGEDGDSMTTDTVLDHPHVYTIADKAHRLMTDPANWVRASGDARPRDQSIIISGESGAGKTEAAKYVMRYLISASQVISGKEEGSFGAVMERCLLQSTVVLEAFGNAKTVRNDNSSRFGKYIKLQYDPSWEVVGARTMHFLLEKSRVVGQDKGERGYHVFYQLCQGLEGPARTELHLAPAEKFDILNAGGVFTQSEEVDDKEQFRSLEKALEVLGIDKGRQGSLWRLLAALLHMGNIVFNQRTDQEIEASGKTHKVELDSPLISVHDLAAMIGLPAGVLVDSIRTRTSLTGRGSWFNVPLNSEQAKDSLQGLIKHIYGQLFSWLVGKVNESHVNETRQVHGGRHGVAAFIGILDIFGFEIMHVNSFEQLCINYANEVLQQQFNHHVFIVEQEMYASEGVDWTTINFRDNQPVIDLISKKPNGLLIQMEELGLLGRKADNRALLQLYHNTHLVSCEYYAKPRFEGPEFIIKHFAGDVTYNVVGFLEKNNDSLHDSLLDLIDSTSFDFLKELCSYYDQEPLLDPLNAAGSQSFTAMPSVGPEDAVLTSGLPPPPGPGYRRMSTGGGTAAGMRRIGSRMENKVARQEAQGTQGKVHQITSTVTVSRTFRMQLSNLMATLTMTEPHYIKCIKPNNVKAPGGFSPHLVLQQLNYSGVLEVVRIRRVGYPIRVPYQEFCDRFALLRKAAEAPEGLSDAQSAQTILERYCEPEYFQMGKTLVFLKEDGLELLRNEMRAEYSAKATKIQALARGYLCRKRLANEKVAAVKLQKVLRGFTRRSSFQSTRAKVELLQRVMRGNLVKKKYKGNRDSAIKLQALVRGVMARKELQRMRAEDGSARKIQAMWRGGVAHQQYKEKMRALRTIQLWLRRQLRNWSLRQQIAFAFKAAEDGQVNAIASIIQKNAEILYIRNRLDKFKALLHAAALGGNTSLVSLLDPLPEDLQLVDTDGNTPMHYAASSCCYDLVKLLAQKANQNVVIPDHISGKGTLDMNALEVRATKRISLRIIDRARTEMNKPHAVRRGSVLAPSGLPQHISQGVSPVHCGWLLKRRATGKWQRRFCVATEENFMYFHKAKDYEAGATPASSFPLATASLRKSSPSDDSVSAARACTFEILSPELLLNKRNKEGRLFFKALSEADAFAWLVPLRVLCKEHNMDPAQGKRLARFVDLQGRRALVRATNKAGETPLHFVAKFADASNTESHLVSRVQIASWLVENGSDVCAASASKHTVTHMALANKYILLAAAMVRKGGDLSLRTTEGISCMDLVESEDISEISVGYIRAADQHALLDAPVKMTQLTYLTMYVEKTTMQSTANLTSPMVSVSVYNAGGKLIEKQQDIIQPVLMRPTYLWWSANWHLQNPLENMGVGSFVLFELKDLDTMTGTARSIAWGVYKLETSITSQETNLEMYSMPVDLSLQNLSPADAFLAADISLTTQRG